MNSDTIMVDRAKAQKKLAALDEEHAKIGAERDRLRTILEGLNEFAISKETNGAATKTLFEKTTRMGRPRTSALYDAIKLFIGEQPGVFTSHSLREAAQAAHGFKVDRYHQTVRTLVGEKYLTVVEQPIGRKTGTYKKGEAFPMKKLEGE